VSGAPTSLAIVGGRVLRPDGSSYIDDGVVLVEGTRIQAVASRRELAPASHTQVIDAEGGYVLPGLIDSHNHLYLDGTSGFEQSSLEPAEVLYARCLANAVAQLRDGVTTLRDCGTPQFVDLRVREAIATGRAAGPRVLAAGQWITKAGGHGAFAGAAWITGSAAEAAAAARENARRGTDLVKVMVTGGSPMIASGSNSYFTAAELAAIVDAAHESGTPVAAHIHGGSGLRYAVDAGIDTIEHGALITDDRDIEHIARRGVAWMFNQGTRWAEPPAGMKADELVRILRARESSLVALEKARAAGIRIVVGADGHHTDHALVFALESLVMSGASHAEALQAATRTAADVLGIDCGRVEPGRAADLIVVERDPLVDISAVRALRAVMKQGTLCSASPPHG
jgi:imidazolonepropionase-like amidohydrolase